MKERRVVDAEASPDPGLEERKSWERLSLDRRITTEACSICEAQAGSLMGIRRRSGEFVLSVFLGFLDRK